MDRPPLRERVGPFLDRAFNPILQREMRGTFRGLRFLLILMGLLAVISVSLVVVSSYAYTSGVVTNPAEVGGRLHTIFLGVLALALLFVLPGFASTSLVGEIERDTYAMLRTTTLSEGGIVWGKFLAAMAYAVVFLTAALPLGSVSFLFGGVSVGNLVVSYLVLLLLTAAVNMSSLFVSSQMRRSRAALSASMVFSLAFLAVTLTIFTTRSFGAYSIELAELFGIPASILGRRASAAAGSLTGQDWWLSVVLVPLYLFFAVMIFSYVSAVNRLKPLAGNRSTNLRLYYLVFLPLGAVLALRIMLVTNPEPFRRTENIAVFFGVVGLFMLLSTFFPTEDPQHALPPRLRGWARGWRRAVTFLGPGAGRGYAFALLANVATLLLVLPSANRYLEPLSGLTAYARGFTGSLARPTLYLCLVLLGLVFCVSSFSLFSSVLLGNDKVRKALVSGLVVLLVFAPLISYGLAHSFKRIERASAADLGFASPVVAVSSLSSGYWDLQAPRKDDSEDPDSTFPYRMTFFGRDVPVFAGFLVLALVLGVASLAGWAVLRVRQSRNTT